MQQNELTVFAPIKEGRLDALESLLGGMAEDAGANDVLPLGQIETLHFASLVIVADEGGEFGPHLSFECSVDGEVEVFLHRLVDVLGEGVTTIFEHCVGFPTSGAPAAVRGFLDAYRVRANVFLSGTPGRSVRQIRRERLLSDEIQRFLDAEQRDGRLADRRPDQVRARIQDHVRGGRTATRVEPSDPRPGVKRRTWGGVALVVAALVALLVWKPWIGLPVLGAITAGLGFLGVLWLLLIRICETREPVAEGSSYLPHLARVRAREDTAIGNHIAVMAVVKPSIVRRVTLRLVLGATRLLAPYRFGDGVISGIRSIHFARWTLTDGGRRLLFLSNFDGSWESYLGDFIDRGSGGLTAIWSNCVGFPKTRFLAGEGARDEETFKFVTRKNQAQTRVWYNAYPTLSVSNIHNNAAIVQGLFGDMNEREVSEWLRRL